MIEAFLFDLDGVIVDTAIYHYKAWRKMANKLGFDISEDFDEKLKGISRMESLDLILSHGNIQKSEKEKIELATEKNNDYLDLVKTMDSSAILEGILPFFDQIKSFNFESNHKIKIGLGSVSKNAPLILERIGLLDAFDTVIDGNKITKGKPDPEVFLNGAKALGLRPSACVVVEDAVAGVEAGKAAGMKVIGIGNPEILKKADLVIKNFNKVNLNELLKMFA
jgi:beta-phosphoglucomutase